MLCKNWLQSEGALKPKDSHLVNEDFLIKFGSFEFPVQKLVDWLLCAIFRAIAVHFTWCENLLQFDILTSSHIFRSLFSNKILAHLTSGSFTKTAMFSQDSSDVFVSFELVADSSNEPDCLEQNDEGRGFASQLKSSHSLLVKFSFYCFYYIPFHRQKHSVFNIKLFIFLLI